MKYSNIFKKSLSPATCTLMVNNEYTKSPDKTITKTGSQSYSSWTGCILTTIFACTIGSYLAY